MKTYDYIILGAGISGLSLAYKLAKSQLHNKNILVIDEKAKVPDHALAFWENAPSDFESIVFKTWSQVGFRSNDYNANYKLRDYKYKLIKTTDFYNFVYTELKKYPNITILKEKVENITDKLGYAEIKTNHGTFKARFCFDSIFKNTEVFEKIKNSQLYSTQYFTGWEIKTSEETFDPEAPILFDLRTNQGEDFRFFYILPYSKTSALIEFVHLKSTDPNKVLKKYITEVLEIIAKGNPLWRKDYEILKREGGSTPLTNYIFPRKLSSHVLSIGIKGGQAKPSSGYVFTRIQKDSEYIANSLIKYNHPFNLPKTSWFYRICDSTFLDIFENNPNFSEKIFVNLFKNYPVDKIFKFLDEKANLFDKFLMGCSFLPLKGETRKLFFKTLFKNIKKSVAF
jgi:lycopene beta-cyclase